MIVDDHELFARSVARLLADEPGVEVVAVETAVTGLEERARAHRPDVALVDWNLPDGSGAGAIDQLRRGAPGVRTVVLTGEHEGAVVRAALAAGCDGFITKDRPPEELVDALRAAAKGSGQLSADAVRSLLEADRSAADLGLTERELEVVRLLATSATNAQIGEELFLSANTVRNHVARIAKKLGVGSRLEIVLVAGRAGVVDLTE